MGEISFKLLLEAEVAVLSDMLDTLWRLYAKKCDGETVCLPADQLARLTDLALGLRVFGGTGRLYLPTYVQPEYGYYKNAVARIRKAVVSLPGVFAVAETKEDVFGGLAKASQEAYFLAATLPRGGTRTPLGDPYAR